MSELNIEISNFGAKIQKLFPSDVPNNLDYQSLISLPLEELCRLKKIGSKKMKDLISAQNGMAQMSRKIEADESFLDVLAKGCLARLDEAIPGLILL